MGLEAQIEVSAEDTIYVSLEVLLLHPPVVEAGSSLLPLLEGC